VLAATEAILFRMKKMIASAAIITAMMMTIPMLMAAII
jgi:hypothetical protein